MRNTVTRLPPALAAVQKPLYALAYKMAAEHAFKSSFVSLVYEKLTDYEPKIRTTAANAGAYTPPAARWPRAFLWLVGTRLWKGFIPDTFLPEIVSATPLRNLRSAARPP